MFGGYILEQTAVLWVTNAHFITESPPFPSLSLCWGQICDNLQLELLMTTLCIFSAEFLLPLANYFLQQSLQSLFL